MEEEVYRLLFRLHPLLFFLSDSGGLESRSMQSKHFKSLISCFLNIQTPFCGQKLAFPTELKGEFAFYRILFSKQAVQVLHTYVSHTERASEHFGVQVSLPGWGWSSWQGGKFWTSQWYFLYYLQKQKRIWHVLSPAIGSVPWKPPISLSKQTTRLGSGAKCLLAHFIPTKDWVFLGTPNEFKEWISFWAFLLCLKCRSLNSKKTKQVSLVTSSNLVSNC